MQANWTEDKCSICQAEAIAFAAHSGTHYRHDGASSKWHWSKGGSSPLYFASGERFTGALHVVEGESDTHALHAAGFRAIGVLGSSSLRKAFDAARECGALSLDDEVIVWREPGAGGDQFVKQAREYCAANGIALRIASYPIDASDMRELLTSIAEANRVRLTPDDGFGGVHSFLKLCAALPVDDRFAVIRERMRERVNDLARDAIHAGVARESVIDVATAQPVIDLEVPAGWRVSQRLGVEIDAGERGFVRVIPVLLTIDCVEVDSHDASERLRLRWQARGRDFQVSVAREVVANTRRIVDLAAHGLPITSENARGVVRWLFELETLNELPRVSVARRSGWVRGELICSIDDLAIDDDSGSGRLLSGLHSAGHELVQDEFLRRVLTNHPMASVMLAASLSAALLHPLR